MSAATRAQGSALLNRLVMLISVAGALIYLSRLLSQIPELPWALAGFGLVGMLVRSVHVSRRQPGACNTVDTKRLHALDLDPMKRWVKQNLRGHDAVVEELFDHLQMNLKLAGPGRTLGNVLLVGPTGTGKTFLAHLTSRVLFSKSEPVLVPMNQYKNPQDVIALLGGPGSPGGTLTAPVKESSHRVVVLDEIEKAHRDLHHALFDILDTGSSRDKNTGEAISFGGCLFMGTCNAGVEALRALIEAGVSRSAWIGEARNALASAAGFEKAFLARWDQILLMDELTPAHVAEVACLKLAAYWSQHEIKVTYASPELLFEAVRQNAQYSEYGVRQLANVIRTQSDRAILRAKEEGFTWIELGVDEAGRVKMLKRKAPQ